MAYDKATKRIVLIAIALAVICSENGYARDKAVGHYFLDTPDCREFLEEYASVTFTDPDRVRASSAFHKHKHWIWGYISAYNMYVENGKKEVLSAANMPYNDTLKWLGAWCRDNMSKTVFLAIQALL